ncbi:MAG TPA: histidine phosphatase family protein [Chloroflexota bacterium]|nr:histidine phosphatase family protein [Chloroflexota bacterium]
MKRLYLVRHCQATGQEPEALLTPEGVIQAETLADFLSPLGIQRIVSSPFVRAVQSIRPLANRLRLQVKIDSRLAERVLSTAPLTDWWARYQASFEELDVALEGGESSRAAMARGAAAVEELLAHSAEATVAVSHGNLLTLIRRYIDGRSGYEEWKALTNPDVFCLEADGTTRKLQHLPDARWSGNA